MSAKEYDSTTVSTRFHFATALTNTGGGGSFTVVKFVAAGVLAVYNHVHGPVTSCAVYLPRSYCLCSNKCQPVERLTTQFVSVSGEGSTHPTELSLFP